MQDLPFLLGGNGTQGFSFKGSQLFFEIVKALHDVVPAFLERRGNQAVGGINGLVSALREVGLITCPLDRIRHCAPIS